MRRESSIAPVPERPATYSDPSGKQKSFWTSISSRCTRVSSEAAGRIACCARQSAAARRLDGALDDLETDDAVVGRHKQVLAGGTRARDACGFDFPDGDHARAGDDD